MAKTSIYENGTPKISIGEPRLKHELSPRWVRVEFNDEFVADSKDVLLVWDRGHSPVYYFPLEDVRPDFLEPGRESSYGRQYFDVVVGGQVAEAAAWSYPEPAAARDFLEGYITFKWNKMDHWYEEEEEVFVHARDPYHRVDSVPSSRHIRVEVNGVTVADSRRPVLLFETNLPTRYYLPQEDVRMDLLETSRASTLCPYKGAASYWSVKIEDKTYRNIVWGYLDPIPESPKITGLLSFFNEQVDIYVDGELENRPQTDWS
jgi:uncharacterized protein (DUF427 family)